MDIIDILLGLLVVVVPVIFNAIGKALDKAGKRPGHQTVRPDDGLSEAERVFQQWQETLARSIGQENPTEPYAEQVWPVESEPYVEQEPYVEPVWTAEPVKPAAKKKHVKPVKPSVPTRKAVREDAPKTKKEKIDPKKLIVYSEIMKPKYTEK